MIRHIIVRFDPDVRQTFSYFKFSISLKLERIKKNVASGGKGWQEKVKKKVMNSIGFSILN